MIFSAILLGLISSLHCIGMCGPIAMMLPVDHSNPSKKAAQILLYHSGRLTAYSCLGLIFGILGRGFYMAGLQQHISIIAGIIMIIIVMLPEKIVARYNFSKPVYKIIASIKSGLGNQFRKRSSKALLITGLLNGFLPCGLVYAALFGAISMPSLQYSVFYMLLYGVGTIPLMSLVVYVSSVIKSPFRNTFAKIVPYAAVLVGMLFIVRGLGLGIPYLSPGNLSLFVGKMADCR
jgi:sulfite exporter TauE/SafE